MLEGGVSEGGLKTQTWGVKPISASSFHCGLRRPVFKLFSRRCLRSLQGRRLKGIPNRVFGACLPSLFPQRADFVRWEKQPPCTAPSAFSQLPVPQDSQVPLPNRQTLQNNMTGRRAPRPQLLCQRQRLECLARGQAVVPLTGSPETFPISPWAVSSMFMNQ